MERLGLLSLLLLCPVLGWAQGVGTMPYVAQGGYYRFVQEGELPIRVNAWGSIPHPGRYEVARGTTLSTLVALTGGPSYEPREEGARRTTRVRVLRGTDLRFDQTVRNDAFALQEDFEMLDGDVMTVETTVKPRQDKLQQYAPVVGAAASVLSALVVLIVNIAK